MRGPQMWGFCSSQAEHAHTMQGADFFGDCDTVSAACHEAAVRLSSPLAFQHDSCTGKQEEGLGDDVPEKLTSGAQGSHRMESLAEKVRFPCDHPSPSMPHESSIAVFECAMIASTLLFLTSGCM